MPDLRLVTWNAGGECGERGSCLTEVVDAIDAQRPPGSPPVQVVAIQEAHVGGGGIATALTLDAPFSTHFIQPPALCREHRAGGQPLRVQPAKAYRLAWRVADADPAHMVTALAPPCLVDLDPAGDECVRACIDTHVRSPRARGLAIEAATNMRQPVYIPLCLGAGGDGPAGGIAHLLTWHAPLAQNWLGARFSALAFTGPGLPEAFLFLQASRFHHQLIAGLGDDDVVIIAGDLNMTGSDAQLPGILDGYVGITAHLCHVLARGRRPVVVDQDHAWTTPHPPHPIVTARICW